MSERNPRAWSCAEVRDSLPAYALGALEADERIAIDSHLINCEECRDALAHEIATADALGWAVRPGEPAPSVRARLLTEVASEDAAASAGAPKDNVSTFRRWSIPALASVAALLLVAVGVLGVMLNRAVDDRDQAVTVAQLMRNYASSGGNSVQLEAMHSDTYETYPGRGTLLTAPAMQPVVVIAGCPETGKHVTYWVWLSQGGERTPVGKLTVGEDGSGYLEVNPDQPLSAFDQIGITIEWKNSEHEDVLVGPL